MKYILTLLFGLVLGAVLNAYEKKEEISSKEKEEIFYRGFLVGRIVRDKHKKYNLEKGFKLDTAILFQVILKKNKFY